MTTQVKKYSLKVAELEKKQGHVPEEKGDDRPQKTAAGRREEKDSTAVRCGEREEEEKGNNARTATTATATSAHGSTAASATVS